MGEGGEGKGGSPRSGGGEGRGRGKGRLTGECAQLRFLTGKRAWDFVSLGAVLPSTDGRRNSIVPAQSFPFQDTSLVHALPNPPTCSVRCLVYGQKSLRGGIRISGIQKSANFQLSHARKSRWIRSPRVLGSAGTFHEGIAQEKLMAARMKPMRKLLSKGGRLP